jgi:DNA polymerase V
MKVTLLGHSALRDPGTPRCPLPLFTTRISAGFPSPAQDYVEQALDLNELCVQRPAATFFLRVEGDSMIDAGIFSGDILVVDRSIEPIHGDVVIACVDGEFTVKELALKPKICLLPRNSAYNPIEIAADSQLEIFGVVTNVVRRMRRGSNF